MARRQGLACDCKTPWTLHAHNVTACTHARDTHVHARTCPPARTHARDTHVHAPLPQICDELILLQHGRIAYAGDLGCGAARLVSYLEARACARVCMSIHTHVMHVYTHEHTT